MRSLSNSGRGDIVNKCLIVFNTLDKMLAAEENFELEVRVLIARSVSA